MYWGENMARGKSNHTMFHKIMGNLEKMQAIGDIISYFLPYYFNCRAEKSTKIRLGENMARGKSNHVMFHKIMGNLEKNAGNRGHNIIFFPYYFNCHTKKSTKIQLGENI